VGEKSSIHSNICFSNVLEQFRFTVIWGVEVICLFISFGFSALKILSLSAILMLFQEKEGFGEH
jgi:hypothetical protein